MSGLATVAARCRPVWRPLLTLLLCTAAGLAHAQYATDDAAGDPPDRVARLSYMAGDIGLLPAGASTWRDASINRPLTTGDRLSSGTDARVELELGGATLRMASRTDAGLLELNDQIAQIELTQGSLMVTVRRLDAGQSYEIDTPTVALVLDQPGEFRVDIARSGQGTQVTAYDGSATVYGENNAQRRINPGRRYQFDDASVASLTVSDIDGGDAFDAWSSARDRRYAQSITRQYVSDDVVGYQDLDQYGSWQDTSDYGAVWYPSDVDAGWAPYRDGHWSYIAPWGWTWVDNLPWGFAPYHYGRWAYTTRGWGWIPGPRGVPAIYAPALVAFVGGGGWSMGIGGPVGWFPLGPGEIYNPWYRCNRTYYTRINVSNIRDNHGYRGRGHDGRRGGDDNLVSRIDNHYKHYRDNRPLADARYVNRNAPHGLTAVSGQTFAGGRQVQHDRLAINTRQRADATVLPRGAALRPLAGNPPGDRSAHVRGLPVGGFQREVVARRAPPSLAAGSERERLRAGRDTVNPPAVRLLDAGERRVGNPARVIRITSDVAPADRRNPPVQPPSAGELPSARFAHPAAAGRSAREDAQARRALPDGRESMPRPAAGYAPVAPNVSARGMPYNRLPPTPQIESARRIEPMPSAALPQRSRFETPRQMPDRIQSQDAGLREAPNPRFGGAQNLPRREMQPAQPMRPNYAPPPRQAFVPQPRPAMERAQPFQPARAQPHPAPPRAVAEPRERAVRKEDQHH